MTARRAVAVGGFGSALSGLALACMSLPAAAEIRVVGPAEGGSFNPATVVSPGGDNSARIVSPDGGDATARSPGEFDRGRIVEPGEMGEARAVAPGEGRSMRVVAPGEDSFATEAAAETPEGSSFEPWSDTSQADRPFAETSPEAEGAITFGSTGAPRGGTSLPAARSASVEALAAWREARSVPRTDLTASCKDTMVRGRPYLRCGEEWYEKLMLGGRVAACPVAAPASAWRNELGPGAEERRLGRQTFYCSGGSFYTLAQVGGSKVYLAVNPPAGLELARVPEGALEVSVGGARWIQFERVFLEPGPGTAGAALRVADAPR